MFGIMATPRMVLEAAVVARAGSVQAHMLGDRIEGEARRREGRAVKVQEVALPGRSRGGACCRAGNLVTWLRRRSLCGDCRRSRRREGAQGPRTPISLVGVSLSRAL